MRPDGSRHWIYRFQFNKKDKNTSLGAYPQVSLTQVRDIAIEARALVGYGHDPILIGR